MKNKETLKYIASNIKGSKKKIILLSISQIMLGIFTVSFSFILRFIIDAIEKKDNELLWNNPPPSTD